MAYMREMVYLILALLIYLDALLTYIAVGHLGAVEVTIPFLNRNPNAVWIVAALKSAGVLYLALRRRRYR